MGFEKIQQWTRHLAVMNTEDGVKIICARCKVVLPTISPLNQSVLSREDRIFLGDDPRAEDCHV